MGLEPKLSIQVHVVFFGYYIYPGNRYLGGPFMNGILWNLPHPQSSTTCLHLFLSPSSNLLLFSYQVDSVLTSSIRLDSRHCIPGYEGPETYQLTTISCLGTECLPPGPIELSGPPPTGFSIWVGFSLHRTCWHILGFPHLCSLPNKLQNLCNALGILCALEAQNTGIEHMKLIWLGCSI